jgi:photosystem II stability/assembly factor-like uncharacterized protein
MDSTPSGSDPARDFGRRQLTSRIPNRWSVPVALLVVALALCASLVTAQETEQKSSVLAPLAETSLLLDAVALDNRLVAVGERGHVLISDDGGSTWRQVVVPTRAMLTGVTFVDDTVGFAVGHDAVILRTADGGETWEMVYSAPEDEAPLFDVWFSDTDNGVAIGAYGSHLVTSDGGLTWDFEPVGDTDWHLHELVRSETGKLYLAAEAGFVYRSDDGGESWIELPSPYEGSYFGVLPLDGDTLLLFGLRGHLYRSEDAGESWTELDTSTVALLTNGVRLSDGTIVIVGLGGTVLVSTDDGASFSYTQRPGRRGISAVAETDSGELLLVGEFGVMTGTLAELTAAAD